MRLLLDTHVLVWWVGGQRRLPRRVVVALLDPANEVLVSAATAWEIALKRRLGKLDFDGAFLAGFDERVRSLGFEPLGLTATHMVRGAELEGAHKDPFDRILAGQAITEDCAIVTGDPAFRTLGVKVAW